MLRRTTIVLLIGALCWPTLARGPALEQACGPNIRDSWHEWAQCLRAMRDQWTAHGPTWRLHGKPIPEFVRSQVDDSISGPSVKVTDDMAMLTNERGQPYNAMGQSGVAYFLFSLAELAEKSPQSANDSVHFRALAAKAIRTAITPLQEGGLATVAPCAKDTSKSCRWFHSITRRDLDADMGGTLNQHLHVVRDLGLIADLHKRKGWSPAMDYEEALRAGLNQLFIGGRAAPTLQSFLGTSGWAYYGKSGASPPYRLGTPLDCHYHLHSLELLRQIVSRSGSKSCDPSLQALFDRAVTMWSTHRSECPAGEVPRKPSAGCR